MFYVYVDYTTELIPRPFYVGKGNRGRINKLARNDLHRNIRLKYGFHRSVVYETRCEAHAYIVEVALVKYHQTFMNGGVGWWGANLDRGGMGGRGTPKSPEHREKIRLAHVGKPKSREHCAAMSAGGKGKTLSAEHKRNMSASIRALVPNPEARRRGALIANEQRWSKPMTDEQRLRLSEGQKRAHARRRAEGYIYPKRKLVASI